MSDRLPTYEELCKQRFQTNLDSGLREQWQEVALYGKRGPTFSIQDRDYQIQTHRHEFDKTTTLMIAAVKSKQDEIIGELIGLCKLFISLDRKKRPKPVAGAITTMNPGQQIARRINDVAGLVLQMEANGKQVSLVREINDTHMVEYQQLVKDFPHLRSSLDGERRRWESLFSPQDPNQLIYLPNNPRPELVALVPEIGRRTFHTTPPHIHLP